MCGICGKVSMRDDISEGLLRGMCGTLVHRGPDDEGIYMNGPGGGASGVRAGLGHRRLSVIDISPAGHQPMSNEDENVWIVMNGEIYNFMEIRDQLIRKGHVFKSHSDTEVVIHLYEEKGADCVNYLRGAFAFALWDDKKERLIICRDRVGKKPLYYAYRNKSFIFGSEIKAILADPAVTAEVNRPAVTDYLTYGYTPTPETMFKGIMKFPPAHFMIYEKGDIRFEKYWDLDFSRKIKISEGEYCRRTMELLEESTKIRLISDVPLGAFLSGGIDSSAVVYMMSRLSSRPVKTFSIGFEEKSHSELKYAGIVARRFNTEHHEYIVKPDAIELLPKLVWHYNEPYADSSNLPSYYVAKMTRQEVTVALNGDGGDEDFGGYERFMAARYAEYFSRLPGFLREAVKGVVSAFPDSIEPNNFPRKLKRFILMTDRPYRVRHYNWMSIFRDFEKDLIFTDGFREEIRGRDSFCYLNGAFERCRSRDIVDLVMSADIRTNLLDDLLVKMDVATMANSLEGRSPFLDHKMMEFAASIPADVKIKGARLKYILKKALSGALPKEILSRGKMGFGIPIDKWFRVELKDYSREILLGDKSAGRGYFKIAAVRKMLDDHACGRANHGARIWSLLNLELWHRMFMDKENML
ncbi:MAG: asparagine synthase (glutamine-hydrolyzing) [Candidatus Omnitrophota bacterium]